MISPRAVLKLGFVALSLVASGAVFADAGSVKIWLDKMARAVESLDYRGDFVYMHDDRIEVMRIVHRYGEAGEQERLSSLNGAPREVIRDNDRVTCILPEDESVMMETYLGDALFPTIPVEQMVDSSSRYEFKLGGTERIAGLTAQMIEITPLDGLRFGYRLWLEEESAMLLKSMVIDADGEAVEQLLFTRIDIGGPIRDVELKPRTRGRKIEIATTAMAEVEQDTDVATETEGQQISAQVARWSISDLPAGFKLRSREHPADPGSAYEHLVFTDGMATVSIYLEPSEQDVTEQRSAMGAMNVFTTGQSGWAVTAVGEAPLPTLEAIARSMRLSNDSAVAEERRLE